MDFYFYLIDKDVVKIIQHFFLKLALKNYKPYIELLITLSWAFTIVFSIYHISKSIKGEFVGTYFELI